MRELIMMIIIFGILIVKGLAAFSAGIIAVTAVLVTKAILSEKKCRRWKRRIKRNMRKFVRMMARVIVYGLQMLI